MAKIPPRAVSLSDRERLETLDRDLKLLVFGQDDAVGSVVSAIRLARAGLGTPDKPVGSFLLRGPDGRRQDGAREAARRERSASSSFATT